MKTVLITGGTGLVGNRLSELLTQKGYKVIHLSRRKNLDAKYPAYRWDIENGVLEEEALEQAHYIVHLAGAGIADRRWSAKRKKVIIDSRVKSTELLFKKIKEQDNKPLGVITASAIGLYGDTGQQLVTETQPAGEGFLAEVTKKWETSADLFEEVEIRTVKLRIGIVLSPKGGALAKMLPSYQVRTGAYFGNGSQMYSWIHIEDLASMFMHAIENESMSGAYNAVAPNPVSNKYLAEAIAKALNKPSLIAPVPAFALRLAMGEMADVVLLSNNVSAQKVMDTGFQFKFTDVVEGLKDLLVRD